MIKNIIALLSPDWEDSYRSAMFMELAKQIDDIGGRLIGINRPIYLFTDIIVNQKRFIRLFKKKTLNINNITLIRPVLFIHPGLAKHYNTNDVQKRLLQKKIDKISDILYLKSEETAYWISHPYQTLEIEIPKDKFVIYERYDKYDSAFGLSEKQSQEIRLLEREILRKAKHIIVTATSLTEDIKEYDDKIILMSNSADYEYYSSCKNKEVEVNKGIANIQSPIIGYLGTIHQGTDLKLIREAAAALPGYTFLLVGPVQDKNIYGSEVYKALDKMSNVILTGWLDWNKMPSYLKAFTVGIIPYKTDCEFNRYVDPNKYHEYMAMGLPIVSTRIQEIEKYDKWVKVADDTTEFIKYIKDSVDNINDTEASARMRYAKENGWEKRASEILSNIWGKSPTVNK